MHSLNISISEARNGEQISSLSVDLNAIGA